MYGLTDSIIRLNPAAEENENLKSFHQSLIYVVSHDEDGALGVNLNQFYPRKVDSLSEVIDFPLEPQQFLVPNLIAGGPVFEDRPWILRPNGGSYETAIENQKMALCFSKDGFMAAGNDAVAGLGAVSWAEGRLEQELATGLWLHYPCDYQLLAAIPFEDPPLFAVHMLMQLRFGRRPQVE